MFNVPWDGADGSVICFPNETTERPSSFASGVRRSVSMSTTSEIELHSLEHGTAGAEKNNSAYLRVATRWFTRAHASSGSAFLQSAVSGQMRGQKITGLTLSHPLQ